MTCKYMEGNCPYIRTMNCTKYAFIGAASDVVVDKVGH